MKKTDLDIKSMSAEELEQLSSALLEKEEELSKKEKDLKKREVTHLNHKEHIYDKINIDIKTLDKIIIVLFALLTAVILFGILKAQI